MAQCKGSWPFRPTNKPLTLPSSLVRTSIARKPKITPITSGSTIFLKATESTPSGLLEGKTLAIKDSVGIAGVPSTLGTDVIDPYIPTIDATIVTRILNAGGHILGTSTCEYMSLTPFSYSSAVGVVDNPWGKGYTAGGSSSGSGVLVSKGHIDMAIGGDQGGSIRLVSMLSRSCEQNGLLTAVCVPSLQLTAVYM